MKKLLLFLLLSIATSAQVNMQGSTMRQSMRVRGCTTMATPGASCTVTVVWPVDFPNAAYTVSCIGTRTRSGTPLNAGVIAQATRSVEFRMIAGTASPAAYAQVSCIAIYNQR